MQKRAKIIKISDFGPKKTPKISKMKPELSVAKQGTSPTKLLFFAVLAANRFRNSAAALRVLLFFSLNARKTSFSIGFSVFSSSAEDAMSRGFKSRLKHPIFGFFGK